MSAKNAAEKKAAAEAAKAEKAKQEEAAKAAETPTTPAPESKPEESTDTPAATEKGAEPDPEPESPEGKTKPEGEETAPVTEVTSGTPFGTPIPEAEPVLKSVPLDELPPAPPAVQDEQKGDDKDGKSKDKENAKEKDSESDPAQPAAVEIDALPLCFDGTHYKIGERRYTELSHVLGQLPVGTLLKIVAPE